jgi:1,4-alpha-glucan branching enzyme
VTHEHVGTCCIVLHTHLPWLPHHGVWPVGEEWLYQAWSAAYLPVFGLLERLAAEGRRDLVTLGVTPILAAQLDDPYCLREFHTWLGIWQLRAQGLAGRRGEHPRQLAAYEFRRASGALETFETRWRHGGSPVLRGLADAGVVELLGGPAAHAFQPLLDERLVRFALDVGLDDAMLRFGRRPEGIWPPECGYRPGLEETYAAAGIRRFVVDGPTLLGSGCRTSDAYRVGETDVVVFGRDLDVTYQVWSPYSGYPTGPDYRDFHTFDHDSGFRPARVTSRQTPPESKQPYDPLAAEAATAVHADDFATAVRDRLVQHAAERDGRPGLVVVAYDTELFGHWWHEGPMFLEHVLRRLPAAGVRVTTLAGAVEAGHVVGAAKLGPGSWGSGKDYRVWEGDRVAELATANARVQRRLLEIVDTVARPGPCRRPDLDQLAREALLMLSSDWAFMVSQDTAARYARDRAGAHELRFRRLAESIANGWDTSREAAELAQVDGPFGHLDARQLALDPPHDCLS